MKQTKAIAKGKAAVLRKNGKIVFVKEAITKGLRIECDDAVYTVDEKTKSKLTSEEKLKLK